MSRIERMHEYYTQLDKKTGYVYLAGFFCTIIILHVIIGYLFFSQYNALHESLSDINTLRSEKIQRLLGRIQEMKAQKLSVNNLLASDENFKIGGYFKNLITTLGLPQKKEIETTSQVDKDNLYKESILNAKFSGATMKELTELLEQIESNKRIYAKELEIVESKKIPNTIDFLITIATLQPKASGIY